MSMSMSWALDSHAPRPASPSSASASALSSSSTTASPTLSPDHSHRSTDLATSVGEPDDFLGASAPHTVPSTTMTPISTAATATTSSSSPAGDSPHRRASGRVRKPTAKAQAQAQALDDGKLYSPPLSDTIVVSSPSAPRPRPHPHPHPHRKEPSTTPAPTTDTAQEGPLPLDSPTPEAPAPSKVNNTTPPPPPPPDLEQGKDEAENAAAESPARRVSRRERKPTAKVLSTSPTASAQKRPASPPDAQEAPPRKSARISYSSAKVPSKLRYSVSSSYNEADDAEQAEETATPPSKKSKVVVLKTTPTKAEGTRDAQLLHTPTPTKTKVVVLKSTRLAEVLGPSRRRRKLPGDKSGSKGAKRRSQRHLKPDQEQEQAAPTRHRTVAPREREEPRGFASCDLSCLPPWSRLLAFAEIAKQMPDSVEGDDAEIVPGSAQDWRAYTKKWCECNGLPPLPTHQVNSSELARALVPNTVSQGTQIDPIDLTEPAAANAAATAESQLLSQPVNTILRATDAERLSQLFTGPTHANPSRRRYTTPATGTGSYDLAYSNTCGRATSTEGKSGQLGRHGQHVGVDVNDHGHDHGHGSGVFAQPVFLSEAESTDGAVATPAKRTYEERLRDDHKALSDIRKRASAHGIPWSFNMTFDDIHALLMEVEDRQQVAVSVPVSPIYYHPHPQSHPHQPPTAAAGPDHGLGVRESMADFGREHPNPDSNGFGFSLPLPGRSRTTAVGEISGQQPQPPLKNNRRRQRDSVGRNWISYNYNYSPPSASASATGGGTSDISYSRSRSQQKQQERQPPITPNMAVNFDIREEHDHDRHRHRDRAISSQPYPPPQTQSQSEPASRRLSSPTGSRPKGSRFRVDPRGLLGESPGPGTIINIQESRKNGVAASPGVAPTQTPRRPSRRSRG